LQHAKKRNQAAYWIYVKFRGKQVWERIGPSLTTAREREVEVRAEVVKDEYMPPRKKGALLQEFFDGYFLPWAKREKGSADKDVSRFELHLKPFFGNVPLKDIIPRQIEEYKEHRLASGAKNATVNRDLALLKTIINKAAKWGMFFSQNPVTLAGMLPENNEHVARFLSEEEVQRLLIELPGETRPIFEFALATGIRIGNILSLTWEQIDKKDRVIHLPKTKSGKALRLPLSDWSLSILEKVPRHIKSRYVFCRFDGEPYKDVHCGFKNALERAHLPRTVRIHDLRHSFASWLVAQGVPTALLKELMGHSSLAMVARYTHAGHQTLLEMSNRIHSPLGKLAIQSANNEE